MTKGEQARLMAWRLRVLQEAAADHNVARVCRRFGISRKSFYKWKGRQAEFGDAGLCDRARTPRRSPRATASEVVSKVLYLRQALSLRSGPNRGLHAPVPSHRDRWLHRAPRPEAPWDKSPSGQSEASAARQALAAL